MTTKFNQIFKASLRDKHYQEMFYRQSKKLVIGVLVKYCTKRETLEDAFQDCIMKLYSRHQEFLDTKKGGVEKYLVIMVKNRYLDLLHKSKEGKCQSIEIYNDNNGRSYSIEPTDKVTPETLLIKKELKLQTRKAVTILPEHYKQIITAKYFEGIDNTEIGQQLSMNPNSVPVYVHRALKKLKKSLYSSYY